VEAAGARVEPLRVLAHDDEAHVVLAVRWHQGLDARVTDHRPEVHVLVQLEADPEEQVSLEDAGSHARISDRPEEDRVATPQGFELVLGEDVAGPEVPLGAQVEVRDLHVEAVADGLQDLEALRDDLRTRPVPADHADPMGHGESSSASSWAERIWSARLIAAR
jgi:hypothetical protein